MKTNDDPEIALKLCAIILYALRLRGPMNTMEIAHCIHLDRRLARKYLEVLMKKGLLRSIKIDAEIRYSILPTGRTFVRNLMTLME
jgi:predicted transcriptional regulator